MIQMIRAMIARTPTMVQMRPLPRMNWFLS